MKKTAYTLTLSAAVTAAVFLTACGDSSSSGTVGNYDVGGCMNQVTITLADGESCVVAWGGISYQNTCDASDPANKTVDRVGTVIATGLVDSTLTNPTWNYTRDANANGSGGVGGTSTVSCS